MNFFDDDEIECYAITPRLCEERNLFYSETAASEAALSEEEFIEILKNKNITNENDVQEEMINAVIERYLSILKGTVN
jgi:hypothetical protein